MKLPDFIVFKPLKSLDDDVNRVNVSMVPLQFVFGTLRGSEVVSGLAHSTVVKTRQP